MKRLLGLLIAANILILAANSGTLINLAYGSITEWSTSAGSNTSAVGTEGMSENAAPSSVNDSYREGLAQITRLARQAVLSSFGPSTYTVSAYYITPALVPAAAISGQTFSFVPASTNIGSATLRVGSIAAKTIVKLSNSTLDNGDLLAGVAAMVVDGGTYYHLLNPYNTIAASGITTAMLAANSVTFSKIAAATSGTLMTWDTTGAAGPITPGTSGQVLTSRGITSTPIFQTAASNNDLLVYQDQQNSGTTGTAYTLGTWTTVTLNTEVTDTGAIGSLSGSTIVLPAGSYELSALAATNQTNNGTLQCRLRLRNTSISSVVISGTNSAVASTGSANCLTGLFGSFTITESQVMDIQTWPTNSAAAAGATALSNGDKEIYATIKLRRYSTQ